MGQPKHPYDCKPCKFNWNCGPKCACVLNTIQSTPGLAETPPKRQEEVIKAWQEVNPELSLEELRDAAKKQNKFKPKV